MRKIHKKANVSIYIAFMITAIIIVVIAAVFAPMGVLINTEFYKAGETILKQANDSINNISDATVRTQIQDTINQAFASQQNNIEVNASIFQYSWIFVIGLSAIVVFLFTRKMIEIQGSGGFI